MLSKLKIMAGLRAYDLTEKVAPFLDPQLVLQLVAFQENRALFEPEEINALKIDALSATLRSEDLVKSGANPDQVKAASSFSIEASDSEEYAQYLYRRGEWAQSKEVAQKLPQTERLLWGQLAISILEKNSSEAVSFFSKLDEQIDRPDALSQLTTRAWLAHWSLFVFLVLGDESGPEKLADLLLQSPYMSTVQAVCPWILRYLVVAVLVSPTTSRYNNRRIKELVRVTQQELYEFSDPVIDFVQALFVNYEFDGVSQKLELALQVLENDYFAAAYGPKLRETAYTLATDLLLRIHDKLPIDTLVDVLGIDASSDFVQRFVQARQDVIQTGSLLQQSHPRPTIHQVVAEKTKLLDQRIHQLEAQTQLKQEQVHEPSRE